jgi:broad specificity phosphatase PhoE
MGRSLHVVTHPEVQVDPAVAVPHWGLSAFGRRRLERLVTQPWAGQLSHVFSSCERKALETAAALTVGRDVQVQVDPELGENDRSATGFLPPRQFEALADRFFAEPMRQVQGWESASAAQQRIVRAVARCLALAPTGDVAVVTHGAVGTLLWCHLQGVPIDRSRDQPGQGSFYAVDVATMTPRSAWQRLPEPD